MERKMDRRLRLLVAEYETDGSMKFITGEDLELCIVTKSKERYVPERLEFDEALQEAILQKFVQGDLMS